MKDLAAIYNFGSYSIFGELVASLEGAVGTTLEGEEGGVVIWTIQDRSGEDRWSICRTSPEDRDGYFWELYDLATTQRMREGDTLPQLSTRQGAT